MKSRVLTAAMFAFLGMSAVAVAAPVSAQLPERAALATELSEAAIAGEYVQRRAGRAGRANRAVVVRPGRPGRPTVVRPGRPGRPGIVRPGVRPRPPVVVVRPWRQRPHYGRIIAGVALGAIITAAIVGAPPPPPAPNLCWYWTNSFQNEGYWDYCR